MERAQAPEPKAARVASSASPALTETNLPAWEANSSPIARALLRRTATPVRIRAPVSVDRLGIDSGEPVLPFDEAPQR